jgi:hypothetical protein
VRQQTAAQQTEALAPVQYLMGAVTSLDMVTAQAADLQTQGSELNIETYRRLAGVDPVRVLGGGWNPTIVAATASRFANRRDDGVRPLTDGLQGSTARGPQLDEWPLTSLTLTCSPLTALAVHADPMPPLGSGVQKLTGAGRGLDCFRQSLSPLTDQ